MEAPYRKIDKSDPKNPRVTDEVVYMTADEEDNYHVAQANEALDAEGHFVRNSVSGRYREETQEYEKTMFDYMDVSPKMVFSVATALIPFLENDDANRALMGSNMQRQAVPLLTTEAPAVGTGMETKAAVDSGVCVVAKHAGVVERSISNEITIRTEEGKREVYKLTKFSRSNQSNCYNQRPIVLKGDKVEAGQVIADGPSTSNGELALGKNPLIGFMTWEGYNYEDAVLLSERLVQEDVYTSVHIEEYEAEAKAAKANGFITKPLYKSKLFQILKRFLFEGEQPEPVSQFKLSDADYSGKRILLVEDNELNREIAVEIIGSTGVSIDTAVNGLDAVNIVSQSAEGFYQMILMDIQMPVMDGYEATRQIRSLKRADIRNIPIVAMTANAFSEDVTNAIKAGMNYHLAKPIDLAALMGVLNKYLQ